MTDGTESNPSQPAELDRKLKASLEQCRAIVVDYRSKIAAGSTPPPVAEEPVPPPPPKAAE